MNEKLEAFRAMLEEQQFAGLAKRGFNPEYHKPTCRVKFGGKYAKVDVGDSGKYMVVLDTGEIYGIKGYGVIHRGHYYGTLDTINEYDWSGYVAHKLAQAA